MITSPLHRLTAFGAIAVTAALALSACGGGEPTDTAQPGDNKPSVQLVEEGKLKTCTSLPYPPFQEKKGGEVVGFDVDMIDKVAEEIGVEQEILDIKFDLIKSGAALNSNRCDIAAAGMTITPERQKVLDFSSPYFDETLTVIAKKDAGIQTLDDVKAKNLKLGVQVGTTSLDLAEEKGFTPTEFDDAGKQLAALRSGQVEVVLQDLPTVNEWLKSPEVQKDFQTGEKINTGDQYGWAVRKGNTELLKVVNDVLAEQIESGGWAESYKKWIGSEPETTPSPK